MFTIIGSKPNNVILENYRKIQRKLPKNIEFTPFLGKQTMTFEKLKDQNGGNTKNY